MLMCFRSAFAKGVRTWLKWEKLAVRKGNSADRSRFKKKTKKKLLGNGRKSICVMLLLAVACLYSNRRQKKKDKGGLQNMKVPSLNPGRRLLFMWATSLNL